MNGKKAKALRKLVFAGEVAPDFKDRKYHYDEVSTGASFWLDKETGRVLSNEQMADVVFDHKRYEPYKHIPPVQSDKFRRTYQEMKKHVGELL